MNVSFPNNLPDELIEKILLTADFDSIASICQSDKRINEICKDDNFWRQLIVRDFPWFVGYSGFRPSFVIPEEQQYLPTWDTSPWFSYFYYDINIPNDWSNHSIYLYLHYYYQGLNNKNERDLITLLNNGSGIRDFIEERVPSDEPDLYYKDRLYNVGGLNVSLYELDGKEQLYIKFETRHDEEIQEDNENRILRENPLNHTPAHVTYKFKWGTVGYINSIYLAQLYRNNISINFLDFYKVYYHNNEEVESYEYLYEPTNRMCRDIMREGNALKQDIYMLQLFHAVCIMYRKYLMAPADLSDVSMGYHMAKNVKDGDKWRGEELNKADFWAYRVGKTMLYFRPCGFIVKIIPLAVTIKGTYPQLTKRDTEIDSYTEEQFFQEMVWFYYGIWLSRIFNLNEDSIWMKKDMKSFLIKISDEEGGEQGIEPNKIDPYILLQSPHFFGEYMYPEGLTASSKVIILGEI